MRHVVGEQSLQISERWKYERLLNMCIPCAVYAITGHILGDQRMTLPSSGMGSIVAP